MSENQISIKSWKSPVGELILGSIDDKLCLCDWKYRKLRDKVDTRLKEALNANYIEKESPIVLQTITQLEEYFEGNRKTFDIPLRLAGTPFQVSVWKTLLRVNYGYTESYLGLATVLGKVDAIRAVASANGANAISILIPCHRIIGKDGKLTGYAGGLKAKKELLELEGAISSSQPSLF
ncbi:MAG: methylated-DNA--[protein]-cysteine S-methyltransferase [Flavobacteriales bacterium]|jgi:methylated-DNA-[protein]-cysteine S-methyltransferase|tara:strand:+ start:221 stop:757 length:537 start_codon:yes stop_codon:yes gene_type:complete